MAIDIDTRVEAHFFKKWMTVGQLRKILGQENLSDNSLLFPNRVGNLTVSHPEEGYVGFIDFNLEIFEKIGD